MGTLDSSFRALKWCVKSCHVWLESLATMVREEIDHFRKDLTLREKLRAWRYGLMSESYVLYGLRDKEPNAIHHYLSDMARFLKLGQIDGWCRHVLQDKLVFSASMAFNDHHYVPKIHAQILHGSARIDLETGQLGLASPYLRRNDLVWHAQHLDAQANIEDVQIPGWPDIKKRTLGVAEKFPQLPYVGWDVLLSSDDQFTLLEGNVKPGTGVLQMHEPLLRNPKIRRFYQGHRII